MAVGRQRRDGDTAAKVLAVAEQLVQVRGFNGFSYADVAAQLEITTASLHYHFASKAELGEALISRYAERFTEGLAEIDARPVTAAAKLQAYATLYADVMRAERMCLCGMLAAEYHTLPKSMRTAVTLFFDDNEVWLERVLKEGQKDGTLHFAASAIEEARMIVSGLEGAMLVARSYGDLSRFQIAARRLLAGYADPDSPAARPRTQRGKSG
jgi:TetR/AcrR family transcriptional regulator, transcriptional repressor for nem operon